MRWEISRSAVDAILSAAASAPTREMCGLLLGSGAAITAWSAAGNVAGDPEREFEIDPATLFAALRAERAGGPRILGYVHSHPRGDTRPSATDAAMAAGDGKLWMIVAGGGFALWRSTTDGFVTAPCDVMAAPSPVAEP